MSRKGPAIVEELKLILGGMRPQHCFSEGYWEVVGCQYIALEELGDPGCLETVYMNLALLRRR